MNKAPFKKYIKESESAKRDKGYAWHTAIGLQAVDGLKISEYLAHTAVRNIEADKVSARIAALLSERAFSFTPNEYLSIHRKLFNGIYSLAGHIRDYNITKNDGCLFHKVSAHAGL